MANIGKRIKARREELGMTQAELAKRLGYKSKTTIAKIESGVNDIVQSKVVSFAEALNTTPAYLMGWEEKESLGSILSKNLKMYRETFGLSISVVASALDSSPDYVEALENNTLTPTPEELRALADLYCIPVQDFWSTQEKERPNPKAEYIMNLLYENGYEIRKCWYLGDPGYHVLNKNKMLGYFVDPETLNTFLHSVNDFALYNFDKMLSNFKANEVTHMLLSDRDEPEALNAANDRGATPEEKKNADDIMHNPDEWE